MPYLSLVYRDGGIPAVADWKAIMCLGIMTSTMAGAEVTPTRDPHPADITCITAA